MTHKKISIIIEFKEYYFSIRRDVNVTQNKKNYTFFLTRPMGYIRP